MSRAWLVEGHGADSLFFDNLWPGWRITCTCRWTSVGCEDVEEVGAEFDLHRREARDA